MPNSSRSPPSLSQFAVVEVFVVVNYLVAVEPVDGNTLVVGSVGGSRVVAGVDRGGASNDLEV